MIMTYAQSTAQALYSDNNLIFPLAEDGNAQELFDEVCLQFDNKKIEQDAQGNVYVMAPAGGESSKQNSSLTAQLTNWSERDGRGISF